MAHQHYDRLTALDSMFLDLEEVVSGLGEILTTGLKPTASTPLNPDMQFFEALSNSTLTSLFLLFARIATWQRSFNIVVTNVPGPQFPAYLLGARMQEI